MNILPRIILLRDTPDYLGMNKNYFNRQVRPFLAAIPIGSHGIGFDRLDLDVWADQYKQCNGRPEHQRKLWDAKEHQVSINVGESGMLTNKSTALAEYGFI